MHGTWKTTSGGGGGGSAVALVAVAIVVAAIAGPVVHAVADIVQTIMIVGAVLVVVLVAGGVALLALRLRPTRPNAPLVASRVTAVPQRAAWAPPARPSRADLERELADARAELAQGATTGPQHVHFHGMSAEDIATIMRQHGQPVRASIEEE
jgi:hypothetical protein